MITDIEIEIKAKDHVNVIYHEEMTVHERLHRECGFIAGYLQAQELTIDRDREILRLRKRIVELFKENTTIYTAEEAIKDLYVHGLNYVREKLGFPAIYKG